MCSDSLYVCSLSFSLALAFSPTLPLSLSLSLSLSPSLPLSLAPSLPLSLSPSLPLSLSLLHSVSLSLSLSLSASLCSVLLQAMHGIQYATDGIGLKPLQGIGEVRFSLLTTTFHSRREQCIFKCGFVKIVPGTGGVCHDPPILGPCDQNA